MTNKFNNVLYCWLPFCTHVYIKYFIHNIFQTLKVLLACKMLFPSEYVSTQILWGRMISSIGNITINWLWNISMIISTEWVKQTIAAEAVYWYLFSKPFCNNFYWVRMYQLEFFLQQSKNDQVYENNYLYKNKTATYKSKKIFNKKRILTKW